MKKLRQEQLGRASLSEYKEAKKLPVCILLDNVRSLHNVGSAFRTADAFHIEKMYLTGITGTPPHREIQKTALGATDSVAWEYIKPATQAVNLLKEQGYLIMIIEQTTQSIPLHEFDPDPEKKYCLVFGNEVNGVGDEIMALADQAVEIPQAGTKHSLNISVCLGIVTWEVFKKMTLSL